MRVQFWQQLIWNLIHYGKEWLTLFSREILLQALSGCLEIFCNLLTNLSWGKTSPSQSGYFTVHLCRCQDIRGFPLGGCDKKFKLWDLGFFRAPWTLLCSKGMKAMQCQDGEGRFQPRSCGAFAAAVADKWKLLLSCKVTGICEFFAGSSFFFSLQTQELGSENKPRNLSVKHHSLQHRRDRIRKEVGKYFRGFGPTVTMPALRNLNRKEFFVSTVLGLGCAVCSWKRRWRGESPLIWHEADTDSTFNYMLHTVK